MHTNQMRNTIKWQIQYLRIRQCNVKRAHVARRPEHAANGGDRLKVRGGALRVDKRKDEARKPYAQRNDEGKEEAVARVDALGRRVVGPCGCSGEQMVA